MRPIYQQMGLLPVREISRVLIGHLLNRKEKPCLLQNSIPRCLDRDRPAKRNYRFAGRPPHRRRSSARTAQLARAFREQGLPVVLVNVTGAAPGRTDAGIPKLSFPADWTELVPELEQHPDDHIVSKQRWGAFIGTSLDDYLRQRGVTPGLR